MHISWLILVCCYLISSASPTSTAEQRADRRARVKKCKKEASTTCDSYSLPIEEYQMCWKYKVELCLSQNPMRTEQMCYEQEFTQTAEVCYLDQCVTVEFSFTDCVTY
eukprot:TCONS_00062459-protein